jgi:hypothetical protein
VTTAVRQAPHHRTLTCYTDYRCRLPECVRRYNDRNNERLRAHKSGTYNALVDATPARQHILRLQRAEMSAEAIAHVAGVSVHSILDILRPHPTKRRGRRRRITPDLAAKILAVKHDQRISGRVDATGTKRRVQALVALGWPVSHISRHVGLSRENAAEILDRARVYNSTATAIANAYDTLRRKRPEKNGVIKAHVTVAKNRAARNKWAPPSYWDRHPGAIDDPTFEPLYGVTRREQIAQDAQWVMTTTGLDRAATAARLGVDKSYIDHAFRVHPEYAVEVAA